MVETALGFATEELVSRLKVKAVCWVSLAVALCEGYLGHLWY